MNIIKLLYSDYRIIGELVSKAIKETGYSGMLTGQLTHENRRAVYLLSYETKNSDGFISNLFNKFDMYDVNIIR